VQVAESIKDDMSKEPDDPSRKRDDRRKQILTAAVKVFADKGYHGCRISDVADEAGVAYGLVYHYFGNKDGLLAAIFDTNWNFFQRAVDDIAHGEQSMYDKLQQVVEIAFHAFEVSPLVVKVLVQEFGRHARIGEVFNNPKVMGVLTSIAKIFDDGRQRGELSPTLDPLAMSVIFMGSLETSFVSFVRSPGQLDAPRSVGLSAMKETLLAMIQRSVIGRSKEA
jgi:TetR/AcrR family transcriptional regulator, fatty acid metabolism regulator protein